MPEGGLAAKLDADHRIFCAIDSNSRRHLDIGVLELGHFILPSLRVKFDENGAQHGRVIKPCLWENLNIIRRDLRTGSAGLSLASSRTPAWRAARASTTLDRLQGQLAFRGIKVSILVIIKFV